MKKFLVVFVLSLLLLNCRDAPKDNASEENDTTFEQYDDFLIVPGRRVGMVTSESTEAEVEMAYGEENVRFTSLDMGEGEEELGVIVFPDTKNALEIVWELEASIGKPAFVRLSKENGAWATEQGVQVGTSLEKLEEINGQPFTFYGFEWDYGGLVTDWNGGNLSPYLIVALIPQNIEALREEMLGDVELSSDDPQVRELRAKVGSLVVTFE